jgi:hypothetical protein
MRLLAPSAAPAIAGLLQRCCPSAIPRCVMTVIVDAIYAYARTARTRTHVRHEVFKAGPTVANRYAASAVIGVGRIFRVFTSSSNVQPRFIFRPFLASSKAMRHGAPSDQFTANTAATNGSAPKTTGINKGRLSAITATQPHYVRMSFGELSIRATLNNGEATESLSSEIDAQAAKHKLIIQPSGPPVVWKSVYVP